MNPILRERGFIRTGATSILLVSVTACAGLTGGKDVLVRQDGYFVTQENRLPVYSYIGDKKGLSRCFGDCLRMFLPIDPKRDMSSGELSSFTRTDGKRQLQYDGRPLYTSTLDSQGGVPRAHRIADGWVLLR